MAKPDFVKLSLCVSILNTFSWQDLKFVENDCGKTIFSYLYDIVIQIYKRYKIFYTICINTVKVVLLMYILFIYDCYVEVPMIAVLYYLLVELCLLFLNDLVLVVK